MQFNIKFRPLQLADAHFINNLRRLENMEKLIGGSIRPVSLERDQKWVEDLIMKDDQSTVYYAITELENEEIIGYTSVSNIDYRNGTCFWSGIKLDQTKAGKGYGKQTALKLMQFVFDEMRMVRLAAECQENHSIALNMMLNVGYQKEGLMRKRLFKNGKSNNQWLLSVTDEDYVEIKKRNGL
ncbi:N-acetyltransferase [Pedobacter chinensis]|uniref:N-acetyltransferase n=1 Tax=Pedobacter chinensis TaxID=2282421 RepID=A0A369PYP7_9SPHI|nr:GNAT family protein [Pedobacter chinensis]RDC55819.1 N-acetyltransferase [Pedobacter chinensis]